MRGGDERMPLRNVLLRNHNTPLFDLLRSKREPDYGVQRVTILRIAAETVEVVRAPLNLFLLGDLLNRTAPHLKVGTPASFLGISIDKAGSRSGAISVSVQ